MRIQGKFLAGAAVAAMAMIAARGASATTIIDNLGVLSIDPSSGTGSLSATATLSYSTKPGVINYSIVNNSTTTKEKGTSASSTNLSTVDYEFTIATPVDLLYGQVLNSFGGNQKALGGTPTIQLLDITAGTTLTPTIPLALVGGALFANTKAYNINLSDTGDTYALEVIGTVPTLTAGKTTPNVEYSPSVFAAAVPEPATWAMMLIGFGGLGASMRASRRKAVATA